MTFADSDIPMYLVGSAHPHKADAQLLVERLIAGVERLVPAAEILAGRDWASARDALHVAVMGRHGVTIILSFDADFDRWPGLDRIHEA